MVKNEAKFWSLRNFFLFNELTEDEMMAMKKKMRDFVHCKNEYIYLAEKSTDYVYFLKEGFVKIGTVSEDGKEIIKDILQPGEIFGELSLNLPGGSKDEYAQALGDNVVICAINKADFESILWELPSLSIKVTKMLGDRLVKMERKLRSLVFKDSRSRIIDFLIELGEDNGRKVGDETLIDNLLTHQEMANLTATSRQTVTTVLNELREKNLIYFDRKRILIRDLDAFKEMHQAATA